MRKHHILFFLCLCMIAMCPAFAQSFKRLKPVTITSMTEVERDTVEEYDREGQLVFRGLPEDIFYQCFNGENTVGFLIQPADTTSYIFRYHSKNGRPVTVGLQELNLAEAIFAKSLDNMVDSAHEVPKGFTAPRFYEYQRQYVFYQDNAGDTCVYVNCFILLDTSFHPEQGFISADDAGDYFWYARLNLSKGKLIGYELNYDAYRFVKGRRSREMRGRKKVSVFQNRRYSHQDSQYNALPESVRKFVEKNDVLDVQTISAPHQTLFRVKFTDGSVKGYDANGECLFVRFDQSVSSQMIYHDVIPNFDNMLDAIDADMAAHGYDFRRQGMVRWADKIEEAWIISVDMWKSGKQLIVRYTIDSAGRIIGRYVSFC